MSEIPSLKGDSELRRDLESDIFPEGKLPLESGLLEHDLCFNRDMCRKKSVSNPHMAYLSKTFGAHDATIVKGTYIVGSWSGLEQTKCSTWRKLEAVR